MQRIWKNLSIHYLHQIALAVNADGVNIITLSFDQISAMAALLICKCHNKNNYDTNQNPASSMYSYYKIGAADIKVSSRYPGEKVPPPGRGQRVRTKRQKGQHNANPLFYLVELIGIEPTAYALRTHRSPN